MKAVSIDLAGPGVPGVIDASASLPSSFRVGEGHPRVKAVSGDGWLEDALAELRNGADGILAVPSGRFDTVAAAALAHIGRPVVIDDRWSRNPAVPSLAMAIARVADAELVELRAHIPRADELVDAFTDLVALADILIGPLATLRVMAARDHTVVSTGTCAGRTIAISVQRSEVGDGGAVIRAIGRSTAVDGAVPNSATAAPAIIRFHDADGILKHPTIFESAHRAAWRALHGAVLSGTAPADLARRGRADALIGDQLSPGDRRSATNP